MVTDEMRTYFLRKEGYMADDKMIETYWYSSQEAERVAKARKGISPSLEKQYLGEQVGGTHYQLPIQPVDYILKNGLGYLEGNVIKYVTRHKSKGKAEDIKKAIHYLQMILEEYND